MGRATASVTVPLGLSRSPFVFLTSQFDWSNVIGHTLGPGPFRPSPPPFGNPSSCAINNHGESMTLNLSFPATYRVYSGPSTTNDQAKARQVRWQRPDRLAAPHQRGRRRRTDRAVQQPDLRRQPAALAALGEGFTSVVGITFNERLGGKNVSEGSPIPVVAVPAGLTPVFMTHWRKDDGLGRLFTPSFQGSNNGLIGGGGGICSGFFCPACFATGAPAVPDSLPPNTFINYCVFKNAN